MVDKETLDLTYGPPLTFLLNQLKDIDEEITTGLILKKMIEYRPAIAELTKTYNSRLLILSRVRNRITQLRKSGLVTIETKKSSTQTNYIVIHINI